MIWIAEKRWLNEFSFPGFYWRMMIMIENCKLNQFTINKISHPIYNDNDDGDYNHHDDDDNQ